MSIDTRNLTVNIVDLFFPPPSLFLSLPSGIDRWSNDRYEDHNRTKNRDGSATMDINFALITIAAFNYQSERHCTVSTRPAAGHINFTEFFAEQPIPLSPSLRPSFSFFLSRFCRTLSALVDPMKDDDWIFCPRNLGTKNLRLVRNKLAEDEISRRKGKKKQSIMKKRGKQDYFIHSLFTYLCNLGE